MSKKSIHLVLGIACLGAGLFFIFQAVHVFTVWGGLRIGSLTVPSGLVILPFLIGIGMMFYNHKSLPAKIVTVLGGLFILLSVLMSIRISMNRTSLFDFVLMFGFTAAGVALLLQYWFRD